MLKFVLLPILLVVFALIPIITTIKIKGFKNQLIALSIFGIIIIVLVIPFQIHRSILNLDLALLGMAMAIGLVLCLMGLGESIKVEEETE